MPKVAPQQLGYAELQAAFTSAESEVESLKRQLAWFQKQMFGTKSERRLIDVDPDQLPLDGLLAEATKPEPVDTQTITFERGKAKKERGSDCVTDSGLRFDESVPVEVIQLEAPELNGADADQFEVIGMKSVHRLAQRPASLVVLRYDMPVVKRKDSGDITNTTAPAAVFDQSPLCVNLIPYTRNLG